MTAMTSFEETSVKAVRRFLQTVVVVDNRAGFEPVEMDLANGDVIEPDPFATGSTLPAPSPPAAGTIDGPLDATELSRAFACQMLVCAILKPTEQDRMEQAVRGAAYRADMLVLDWQMNDNGQLASSIIEGVVEDDGGEERLRLVAIYTSQSPLSDVAASLADRLPKLQRDGLVLTCGSTRVVLLSKGGAANAPEESASAVEEKDLPERLVREFALLAQGLLSNATMAAIGEIRDNTHRILARFSPEMDGPLLTHRTLLRSPADADEFAADMIMGELQSQIPIRRVVSEFLGAERVREYVHHRVKNGLQPRIALNKATPPKTHQLTAAQTCDLVEKGIDGLDTSMSAMTKAQNGKEDAKAVSQFKKVMKEELHERLYMIFSGDADQARRDHSEFAVRSKIRRDASALPADWIPRLGLGSVVARNGEFWMCLTPSCDSTRIPATGGSFLFALLSLPASGSFDLVVPDAGEYRRLELERKRTRLVSIHLTPDPTGDVVAIPAGGEFRFEPQESEGASSQPLRWLADLKPMHAQRLVQRYASNLSRVGVDDFEWHRVQMPGGLDA